MSGTFKMDNLSIGDEVGMKVKLPCGDFMLHGIVKEVQINKDGAFYLVFINEKERYKRSGTLRREDWLLIIITCLFFVFIGDIPQIWQFISTIIMVTILYFVFKKSKNEG